MRRPLALFLLAVLLVMALPSPALALSPIPEISISAEVQPDGTVLVMERRTYQDPRNVEFVEMVLPETTTFEMVSLKGSAGAYNRVEGTLASQSYQVIRTGPVVYVEWQSAASEPSVTLTYLLRNMAVVHKDAVEFYWPAMAGGPRSVKRIDLDLTMPSTAGAHLYAYGGEKGGVTVRRSPFRVSATNVGQNHSFEVRLLLPREALPNAQGQSGSWTLAALQATEQARINKELSRANSRWIAHWTLLLALVATFALYWFTVRRPSPEPDPQSLTVEQLTAIPPAAVGWIYDSAWFDFACAQLMHLEARGALAAGKSGLHITLRRVPGAPLDEADETLLSLFFITEEPIAITAIADKWQAHRNTHANLLADWLKLVEKQVPAEWVSRPSPLWAWIAGAVCIVVGVISLAWMEWIALWALGGLMIFMGFKRRWLSPLGESYIARWVSTYYAAVVRGRKSDGPGVPAPYLLAVEVGDDHLERAMGAERYDIVKALYIYLEELA